MVTELDRVSCEPDNIFKELDTFSISVIFASISAAVSGEPFTSLLVIAICYILCKVFLIQVNITNKEISVKLLWIEWF